MPLRVLLCGGPRSMLPGDEVSFSQDHRVVVSGIRFESLASVGGPRTTINSSALRALSHKVDSFDGLLCEASVGFLLFVFRHLHGLPAVSMLLNDEEAFEKVYALDEIFLRAYGRSFLHDFCRSHRHLFLVHLRSGVQLLRKLGVPQENFYVLPTSSFLAGVSIGNPDHGRDHVLQFAPKWSKGSLLAAGDSERDHEVLAAAAELLGRPIDVLSHTPPPPSPLLRWRAPVSTHEYAGAIAGAKVVIVALHVGARASGQLTVGLAQHYGTPVVATLCEATETSLDDGRCGYPCAAGDPRSLAGAIDMALKDDTAQEKVAHARTLELDLRRKDEQIMIAALSELGCRGVA